jgi:hypothetical protein
MCCFLFVLGLMGPRAAIILWWLFDQSWFSRVYDTFIWPALGVIFAPCTTLMYTLVANPTTGLTGSSWFWVALAAVLDVTTYVSGGYGNRDRIPGYNKTTTHSI